MIPTRRILLEPGESVTITRHVAGIVSVQSNVHGTTLIQGPVDVTVTDCPDWHIHRCSYPSWESPFVVTNAE